MGDPEFQSDEQVLVRTPGVTVKSIPFEGILTSRRIVLVDRAKNILPPKEIPLDMIKRVELGGNANGEPVLSLGVMAKTGDIRQMILAFPRYTDRDEWAQVIGESAPPGVEVIGIPVPSSDTPQRVTIRRVAEPPLTRKIVETRPEEHLSPAAGKQEPDAPGPGENAFCNRCGNRVSTDSAFCNRCGAPVAVPGTPQKPATPRQNAVAPAPAEEAPREAAESTPAARPPARKAAKKGLLSGVLGSKKPQEASLSEGAEPIVARSPKQGMLGGIFGSKKSGKAAPAEAPAAPPASRGRSTGLPKKAILGIVLAIVVILIVAAGALFVLPMLGSGSAGTPSGTSSGSSTGTGSSAGTSSGSALTADKVVVKETTRPVIPAEGVYVSVDYLGSWKGTYGMPSDPQSAADSGARYYEVVNATGLVNAVFEKKDSSTKHDLTVQIYRNGALLATGKTGASYGKVTVSADVTTGSTRAVVPAAGNITAAATTAAATVKTTTAAK